MLAHSGNDHRMQLDTTHAYLDSIFFSFRLYWKGLTQDILNQLSGLHAGYAMVVFLSFESFFFFFFFFVGGGGDEVIFDRNLTFCSAIYAQSDTG